jgi:NagD protein
MDHQNPDYVVVGFDRAVNYTKIEKATRLIRAGARFIATNPDPTGPSPAGPIPATGSVAALITRATQVQPYFVGKPNPLMMRSALNRLAAHSETTVMVGDRLDTVMGTEKARAFVLDVMALATAAGSPWAVA